MEAATEQFRALLGACVAVSAAAAASSEPQDVEARVQAVDAAQGLTPDQLQYWDSLCGDSATNEALSLAEDLALLSASTNISANKQLSLLRVLLVHPSLHCAGLTRLAQMMFKGFKLTKRWDVLQLVSTQLLDAVYNKILQQDTRRRALRLYIEILVGFQHSAELFEKNVPKLVKLAELFSADDAEENKELVHPLLVACAALEHCHRGYEAEAMTLRRALRRTFGSRVDRPTAAEAERLLRSSAWVLPADKMDAMLPSVEGKWVVDEFIGDQHGNAGPQNAGSVLLKKTTNCFAHEVTATMIDRKTKNKLELMGYLFQKMPEMQVLLAQPEAMEASAWELEGHWRQLHEENGPATSTVAMAPIAAPTWDCRACTMNNEGNATKCSTCGTERPADVNVPTIPTTSKGSNPAPFSAVFSSDMSFMRLRWSRGEQQGVWLARKQTVETSFDLAASLTTANNVMMDSTILPAFVFSPEGNPASTLVLERAVLSTSNRTEFTVQVWIRPERSPTGTEAQIVLANGHDFELSLTSAGHLIWQIGGGRYTVTSRGAVQFGLFCHVTLSFGQNRVVLLIDGSVAGETARSGALDEAGPSAPGASLLTIGGSFESCDSIEKGKAPSCFYGQILDLRLWSTLIPNLDENWSIWNALTGKEGHLVGYYPLVGDSERLLLDLSKQQNHACVFEGYQSPDSIHESTISSVTTFAPATPVETIPVKNAFAVSLVNDFFGSGKFSLPDGAADGASGLKVERGESGAALWRQNGVSVVSGFQSAISIASSDEAQPSRNTVVFALCESSFWELVPLLSEAARITNESSGAPNCEADPSLRNFDGSAMLVKITSDVVAPGIHMYELGLFIWSKKRGNPLSRVFRVAGGPSSVSSDVEIKYMLPGRVLSIAIGSVGVVFEVAVDLELALGMEPDSLVRTGLIFPATESSCTTTLMDWKFDSLTYSSSDGIMDSVLGYVYAPLQSERSGDGEDEGNKKASIMCTRVSTDGSAIEQEAYGCQTCSLVHGSSICRPCAIICHEGHELVALGVTTTACTCHVRGNGLCRCSSAVPVSDFPLLDRPVNVALWGCSKCTVINSIELKLCSVCGNSAPEVSGGGSSATPESTCTALALVEQPKPAVDWSCEACTMLNSATSIKCSMCETPRSPQAEPEVVQANQESKTEDGLTTLYYAAEDAAKQNHPMATEPTGTWICTACTMENQPANATCHMCSTPREIPIAAAVDPSEVVMALPAPKPSATPATSPMSMDMDEGEPVATAEPAVDLHASKLNNAKYLDEYKRAADLAFSHLLEVRAMNDSVWETTGGKMNIALDKSLVGEYIRGTYLEKDGKLSGLARLTEDGAWKLDGKFKKLSQSQSNACTLYWDKTASRFDGKWYRGDGSGDWKCLAAPYASDFCGLAPTDPAKKPNELQPFYAGMVNMKQNLTNVCYQNSFLQTLYMTQDFRRLILSCDAHKYFAPYANDGTVSGGNVVATIQDLFAQMTASQRPYLATHALQRCLPTEFQNGRQQDTSDFAHFLIDSLSQQLSQNEVTTDDIPSIFGGHQATILACKTCGKKSVNREYFWELLLNMIDLRYTPITSIAAVSGSSMDIHTPEGYERLNTDLNKDRTGAPYVYLCVQRCPERATSDTSMEDDSEWIMPITELVVKVALATDPKPSMPGFERVELDLNVGGGSTAGGKKQVYLFFRREPNGSPITDLQVTYGNESIPDGFKQIQVDLNQGDGSKVYLCYRCDMPITDLKIVNSGIPGYRMVDHLLNVSHEDAVKQYLALKVGGNEPCLTDLKLVENADVSTYQKEGWQAIGSPFSSAPLVESTLEEEPVVPAQLMVRRGHGNPIFAIDVFRSPRQVPKYNDYEVIELFPAEASSADISAQVKGDWMGNEETDRGRKAVRIRSVSEPISDALLVKGALDDKGELSCVATRLSSWSDSITAGSSAADSVVPADSFSTATGNAASRVYRVSGYWKNTKVPSAQLFDVELRPAPNGVSGTPDAPIDISSQGVPARMYTISGTIGDGRGKAIAIQGVQTSRKVKVKWPISGIVVLRGDERVPDGVQVVRETCSGRSGNLLAQTASPHTLYLAVKREEAPTDGYITDVCVIYGEIDAVPENYTCIQTTPAGHSANLNDGTPGVPVFICFRRGGSATSSDGASSTTSKSLMDLALMWTSGAQPDTLPNGFIKIQHTPLGMEANLNQGTSGVAIHICFSKCDASDIVKPLENPLNGEYEITSSPLPEFGRFLSLSVVEELEEVRMVEGNFGIVLHAQLLGSMSGMIYTSKHEHNSDKKNRTIVGAWRMESPMAGGVGAPSMNDFLPSNYPFELKLNEARTEMDGWWSGAEGAPGSVSKPTVSVTTASSGAASTNATTAASTPTVIGGKWKLIKDSYVHVAFKKDYSTEWQDGQLVFSERVWRHDIESMLSRFVATRTLGGDNALSCSACQRKTESRTHTVIFEPPEHLIITLKRMYYDWTQQKACKCLHDVRFPALLTLPSLSADEEYAIYESADGEATNVKKQNQSRHYGLYGVLVHSGLTANSGHYYSFCRESDESTRQLHLEDSSLSPWIKFNDTKVERSNWKEINRLVSSTVSDTVYLLLYKKLSYELPTATKSDGDTDAGDTDGLNSDDEEAMLLAKAMALSMSAAKHNQRQSGEEETKDEDGPNNLESEESSVLSTSAVTKTLLKKVEEENAAFLHDSLAATSSALHADDLHSLLVLRHSLPLHLRSLLDEIC